MAMARTPGLRTRTTPEILVWQAIRTGPPGWLPAAPISSSPSASHASIGEQASSPASTVIMQVRQLPTPPQTVGHLYP